MKSPKSWPAISLENLRLFFTVYIYIYTLAVIDSRSETRNLCRLFEVVFFAGIIGLKVQQLSTNSLWTLQTCPITCVLTLFANFALADATYRKFRVRFGKHSGDSVLTGKM